MAGLKGRTVVVTGASGSLGSAIARRFLAEGVRAVGLVDLDASTVAVLAEELIAESGGAVQVEAVALDVTDHDAVMAAYADLAARFGRLDVAINNAGIAAPSARLHHVKPEDFRRVLDVNLLGVFHCMKAAITHMRGAGGGAIVNTASVAASTNWTHASPYGASKAAVVHLTRSAAAEYAADNVRINCVSPGTFITRFHDGLSPGVLADIRGRHPLGRFGTPDEIAGAYVYLAGSDGGWVTGTSLVIDGGLSVG